MKRFDQIRAGLRKVYRTGRRREGSDARAETVLPPATRDPAGPPADPPASSGDEPRGPTGPAQPSVDDAVVPRGLRIAAAWAWRIIVIGVVGWGALEVVSRIKIVAIPLAIALLLAALLAPAVRWLLRARIPRSLATAVVLVGGLAAVGGTLTLVVNRFIDGVPALGRSAAEGIRQIQDWLQEGPLRLTDGQINNYIDEGQQWLTDNSARLTSGAVDTAATLVEVATGTLLVLFALFFFLRDGERIWRFIVNLLPSAARARVDDAGRASWQALAAYVRATVLVAFIDAVGIGIFLVVFDVPLAFPLTALVFLSAFIPIVGATVSGAIAVLVALVDSGWVTALIILAAVIGVQQIEGNVLQPLIMGRAVDIHPLAVVLAVTAGVVLAGITGALVAVPLIAVVSAAARRLAAGPRSSPGEAVPEPPIGQR